MKDNVKQRPVAVYFLLLLVFLESVSGLFGGAALLLDPAGNILQMSTSFLKNSPFINYVIPGFILFVFLGIYPAILFFGLLKLPYSQAFNSINLYKNQHWSWTLTLYLGIVLILWIDIETMFIGYNFLQTVFGVGGVVILILDLLPSVKEYYLVV